jgi:hypothetical protein
MIAEVCAFYHWTDDHVLKMPASRFFLMLREARKLKRLNRVHDCYVSRCSAMTNEAFFETVGWFDDFEREPKQKYADAPVVNKPEPLKGEAARAAVMGAFAMDRRIPHEVKH